MSDGSDVEKGPWGSDDENTGEGNVQSKMNGEWNKVKSTKDNLALCQMPGKYTYYGFYLPYARHYNLWFAYFLPTF